jgi:phosphatidylserine/phosphatidylglycerophosphate/cardiolipin synthase-like enzyme
MLRGGSLEPALGPAASPDLRLGRPRRGAVAAAPGLRDDCPRRPAVELLGDQTPSWCVLHELACLHTKAFVIDDAVTFVGSFNLDPRSANLHREMGAFVEDCALAGQLRAEHRRLTDPARQLAG